VEDGLLYQCCASFIRHNRYGHLFTFLKRRLRITHIKSLAQDGRANECEAGTENKTLWHQTTLFSLCHTYFLIMELAISHVKLKKKEKNLFIFFLPPKSRLRLGNSVCSIICSTHLLSHFLVLLKLLGTTFSPYKV
jgi:hypothetical protein